MIAEATPPRESSSSESNAWLTSNVLNPFINGTGVRQIADTFTGSEYKPLSQGTPNNLGEQAVQAVSSTIGAIAPYILLGKAAKAGMEALAVRQEVTGIAGTLLRSEQVANVGAAGVYEFLKKPADGQTRAGNSVGTMLSFSAYETGNFGLRKAAPLLDNKLGKAALTITGRAVIGAGGGELSYEASNLVASYTGGRNMANNQGRVDALVSGAVMNEALPVVQHLAGKAMHFTFDPKSEPLKTSPDAGASAEQTPNATARDGTTALRLPVPGSRGPDLGYVFNGSDGVPAEAVGAKNVLLARKVLGGSPVEITDPASSSPKSKLESKTDAVRPKEVETKPGKPQSYKLPTYELSELDPKPEGNARPLTDGEWRSALRSGKFAVMLSGGGQQGYHHLGFMAALNDLGLKPESVTGVSAGSTFHALDLGKDTSIKWERDNPSDRKILDAVIKALAPGEAAGQAERSIAGDKAALRKQLQALAANDAKPGSEPTEQDNDAYRFLSWAKRALMDKQLLDKAFEARPDSDIDLTDMSWRAASPYMNILTGKDLGDQAMHGLPRVDWTELWWKNPFNVWRYALGAEVPQGIPHITTWDGTQLAMLPAFKRLEGLMTARTGDGNRLAWKGSNYLTYDIENRRVVNFQGQPGTYDLPTALAASTSINVDGNGVKPVEAIINGTHSQLVDLGVIGEGRYNSPTGQLPPNMPAIVSQLPRPASERRPNDLVVSYASGQRPPFPLVGNNEVLSMFVNGYLDTRRALATYLGR